MSKNRVITPLEYEKMIRDLHKEVFDLKQELKKKEETTKIAVRRERNAQDELLKYYCRYGKVDWSKYESETDKLKRFM